MSDNVNLSDMMDVPARRPVTTFDFTNGNNLQPTRQVVPVQHDGPINMANMRPADINAILPKREAAPNPIEQDLFADLDAAVDRECESITKRHDALFAAQQEEFEHDEALKEEAAQAAEDDFALNGVMADNYTGNSSYSDLLDNNEDSTSSMAGTVRRVSINDSEEAVEVVPTFDDPNKPVMDNEVTDIEFAKKHFANILDGVNNEDLFEDEDEEETTTPAEPEGPTAQEALDDLKAQIKERSTPRRSAIDLSKFTIAKKAISAQKVMKLAVHKHMSVADWVLPNAGRSISMTGLSGPEILKLNPENTNRNRLNTFTDMYRIVYDHVFDGNKPEYETWLKQLRFVDLQHVYFALYMATFDGSNYLNYSCPKCKKVFIETVDFKDMVVYADDETKAKIKSMLNMDSTSKSNDSYDVTLVPVSDSYVLALRTPSVWNVIMETAVLSDQFLEKHADLIDMVAYIDSAYIIDNENNQLIPVDTKPDPNNMAKTSARRIKAMYDIISTLNSEEYYGLRSAISDLDENATKVSYKIPGCTCPACGEKVPDNTEITPDSMLFTRHQLAAIGNM